MYAAHAKFKLKRSAEYVHREAKFLENLQYPFKAFKVAYCKMCNYGMLLQNSGCVLYLTRKLLLQQFMTCP